jgi:hypothetical protein
LALQLVIYKSDCSIILNNSIMKITHLLAGSMIVFLSALSFSSSAQTGGGGADRMARYNQMLKDSVGLTDVQIDSVQAVRKDFQPQMRAIFQDQSLSQDDKMAKMKGLQTQIDARYASFLTADQVQKLDAMQQRMMSRRRQGGGGGR